MTNPKHPQPPRSRLREHLDAARAQHRATRYPGDLAADLLQPRPSLRIWRIAGPLLALAAAAIVAIVVFVRPAPVTPPLADKTPPATAPAATNPGTVVAIAADATADPEWTWSIDDVPTFPESPSLADVSTDAAADVYQTDTASIPAPDALVPQYEALTLPAMPSLFASASDDSTDRTN